MNATVIKGSEHSYEHYGKHALGPFIGITREDGLNRETIGLEYSYRINKRWSVGGLIERAERDKSSTLGTVFAHFWPTEFLWNERENTVRATIGYEFELGKGCGISPQANLDVIENESNEKVYGIVFSKRF